VALMTLGSAPAGAQAFDHAPFDALLRRHVVDGLVDYDAFKASPEFTAYLASLDRVNPARLSERERLAYWINVYNAFTIRLVTDKNERESIRNINKSLGFLKLKGPWSDPIVRAGGRRLSLDDVEHRSSARSSRSRASTSRSCAPRSAAPRSAARPTRALGSTRSSTTRHASSCSGLPRRTGWTWPRAWCTGA
jgi:hypothetical protein